MPKFAMDKVENLSSLLGQRPHPIHLSYGTAGFRSNADNLQEAVFRVGILAAARSYACQGAPVGVMITASHNPPQDNGVKIVEPDGSMLDKKWEILATSFVNQHSNPLTELEKVLDLNKFLTSTLPVVVVGMDTRESSPALLQLVTEAVKATGGQVINLGLVTTPILHYCVRARHNGANSRIQDYYSHLTKHYSEMVDNDHVISPLIIDCANGIGAHAMQVVKSVLPGATIINRPGDGPLNEGCGADYVQKKRLMPTIPSHPISNVQGATWASLDGDADRLVMYQSGKQKSVVLADGDRFAVLLAWFLSKHISICGVQLRVAVAQTAYSNGAATTFLEALKGVEVVIAKTGVKHLEKAVCPFDIGIYWEPNGHGTVLFSNAALGFLNTRMDQLQNGDQKEGLTSLRYVIAVSNIANQAVGDGVADLLLVLAILSCEKMTFQSWLGMYQERCSSNMVVRVKDKNVITTRDCDRVVAHPIILGDVVMMESSREGCRAFVRPSGTEDVVRVYAEAPSGYQKQAAYIALVISQAVYDRCGGVGDRPQ